LSSDTDWMTEAAIAETLAAGHIRRDLWSCTLDETYPVALAWLERLEQRANRQGKTIVFSGLALAEYGILDVTVATPEESDLWTRHPMWSWKRVQRVARKRAHPRYLLRIRPPLRAQFTSAPGTARKHRHPF
jgi:hypothetical protein